MPLLSLPTDIILEIFSYMHSDSIRFRSSTSRGCNTSPFATPSLVCKQLCALARRSSLKSLRWCDKTRANRNLNQWLQDASYKSLLHVPKKLVVAVEFDEESSWDGIQRVMDDILHERIYTRILSFSSLSSLILSNTRTSAQYLYPVLLSLPMLRSLALIDVEFSVTHKNNTDDSFFSVLDNYPFTSLHLTHLVLRRIIMMYAMGPRETYEYHHINLLRIPSLESVEISWNPRVTAAYKRHVHSKTGTRRQSGAVGWPNTDIPCTVLENNTATEAQQKQEKTERRSDVGLPFERLTRLTIEVWTLDLKIIHALKRFLADCAQHASYDPPVHPWATPTSGSPLILPAAAPRNALVITLHVGKLRLRDELEPMFRGCLAPVVRYKGPLSANVLSLFMDGNSLPLHPSHLLTHVSSFDPPSPTEAEDEEVHIPDFGDVLRGLRALIRLSPLNTTTVAVSLLKVLKLGVHVLDYELLYAVRQLFGSSIERLVIWYAYHDEKSVDTLFARLPDIFLGLPHLRSIILMRIPDPSVIFARAALERHAAVVGDQQRFRRPRHMNAVHPNPNLVNANHLPQGYPHGENHYHLLTQEEFKSHTATMERAREMEAIQRPWPFGFRSGATSGKHDGDDVRRDQSDEEEDTEDEDVREYVCGWGFVCKSLWEVQIERYRFVRRFGEIGEQWTKVPVLSMG